MKSNNQALNLLNLNFKNYIESEKIVIKKEVLESLKNGTILKIDENSLKFIDRVFNIELFFQDKYFFIKNSKRKKAIKSKKIKKSEFILKIENNIIKSEGIYFLSKEPLNAILQSKNSEFKVKLYYKDNFYIKIEE